MVLVDTSVWIRVFSKKHPFPLQSAVELDEVATCLPVVQEVLQGFRDDSAHRLARESLLAFPLVESPMTLDLFEEAVSLFRIARRAGLTIRSGIDCLIGACALRNGLAVLHSDRDFDALARISSLQARNIRP